MSFCVFGGGEALLILLFGLTPKVLNFVALKEEQGQMNWRALVYKQLNKDIRKQVTAVNCVSEQIIRHETSERKYLAQKLSGPLIIKNAPQTVCARRFIVVFVSSIELIAF